MCCVWTSRLLCGAGGASWNERVGMLNTGDALLRGDAIYSAGKLGRSIMEYSGTKLVREWIGEFGRGGNILRGKWNENKGHIGKMYGETLNRARRPTPSARLASETWNEEEGIQLNWMVE